jgi:chaperonin GroES
MNFIPTSGRVIVLPDSPESTTPGGIIIPDNAKEKPLSGKIIAGEGPIFKINMTVLFSKYAGTEITIDGITYLIMQITDIYGYFE